MSLTFSKFLKAQNCEQDHSWWGVENTCFFHTGVWTFKHWDTQEYRWKALEPRDPGSSFFSTELRLSATLPRSRVACSGILRATRWLPSLQSPLHNHLEQTPLVNRDLDKLQEQHLQSFSSSSWATLQKKVAQTNPLMNMLMTSLLENTGDIYWKRALPHEVPSTG